MQFALMIYHTPEEFALRNNEYNDPRLGAWRAYYKALVEAGVYVSADALEVPDTGTTVRLRTESAACRMDPMRIPKNSWLDSSFWNSLPLTPPLHGQHAAPEHRSGRWKSAR